MYSNILVPIALDNEDDRTPQALNIAKTLAADGATITLLHVVEAVPSYAISYISSDILDATRKGIESEMARLAAENGANSVVIEGHAGRSILDYAEEQGNDLIVIASHRPGMQTLLLGSTATHVVRHALCSVHVLR
ncbi:universal stress protein [Marivita sp. XM-24bin2]|jgi:nucleotide-binding universal stress UspA family protein|uniref:universal stress protein n=1 Tax=unclassified Marivita TaxID=2632480 RepID=UPI000D793903|nr:universal stress protein [Marivita sp. XM-24bin2]MCR9109887.1 universal stress protein [Paracoccaceae bacterium]PWL36421.1 MAG: universal stress protein [Marivita sp. XM-24bin2]